MGLIQGRIEGSIEGSQAIQYKNEGRMASLHPLDGLKMVKRMSTVNVRCLREGMTYSSGGQDLCVLNNLQATYVGSLAGKLKGGRNGNHIGNLAEWAEREVRRLRITRMVTGLTKSSRKAQERDHPGRSGARQYGPALGPRSARSYRGYHSRSQQQRSRRRRTSLGPRCRRRLQGSQGSEQRPGPQDLPAVRPIRNHIMRNKTLTYLSERGQEDCLL